MKGHYWKLKLKNQYLLHRFTRHFLFLTLLTNLRAFPYLLASLNHKKSNIIPCALLFCLLI